MVQRARARNRCVHYSPPVNQTRKQVLQFNTEDVLRDCILN